MTFSVEYSIHHPDTGEHAVWFYMTFRADGQVHAVETSNTMWDIGYLKEWLECIVVDRCECRLDIDREWEIDTLLSTPMDGQSVHLVIQDDLNDCEDIIYFDAVVDRRELIDKTYRGLLKFIKSAGLVGRGCWETINGASVYHETTDLDYLKSEEIEVWLNGSH